VFFRIRDSVLQKCSYSFPYELVLDNMFQKCMPLIFIEDYSPRYQVVSFTNHSVNLSRRVYAYSIFMLSFP